MAKVANLKSNIQSKIQQDVNEKQKQIAASSAAAKAGSTETPTVTATPKVTQTAKAMPSLKPEITPVSISNINQTPTVNAKDLLGTSSISLRKAATPDLLSKATENKEVSSNAIPGNVIASADTIGGGAKDAVDKTLLEQFSTWFKETPQKVTQKVGSFFKEPAEAYGAKFESLINDTEYWVAGLADVIETSLGGEGGFKKAFQEKQGWFWDAYSNEIDIEGSKLYQEDEKAQQLTNDVSDWLWIRTGNKELSDTIGEVVGSVSATIKDPKQIAAVAGYMTPALILQAATGGGFLTNTAIWLPSQSTQVYKDFSQDKELSSKYTDNQLFGMSTGVGFVLSLIETFGDALGDMPWAKGMSRKIRSTFTKSILKNQTKKTLTKEITDVVDKNLIKDIKQPILNALRKWYAGSIGEGLEEVAQDTLQTETARALGSKREGMSIKQALTTYFTAKTMGLGVMLPGVAVNIKQNQDLQKQYNDFSRTVDKIAPGINEETKQAFFSAMITSQQNDAKLSEKRVEKYETQVTELYNQISELEQQQETTTDENEKLEINRKIETATKKINDIDEIINSANKIKEEVNAKLQEMASQKEQELDEIYNSINEKSPLPKGAWWEDNSGQAQQPKEVGGENLSEQTMNSIDNGDVTVTQRVARWDKRQMRQDFEKSVDEIIGKGKSYSSTQFANYAYNSSGKYMKGDTEQRNKMIAKVYDLLDGIGVGLAFTSMPDITLGEGVVGQYRPGDREAIYSRNNYDMTLYGHEVLHAMMDVINNGNLSDKNLQKKLQQALNKALNDVKKQMGIDGYKGQEGEIANTFAEEWLANAFGEYLAKRELTGPKTFRQKITAFFNKIIDFFTTGKIDKSLDKELEWAFERIANGEVRGSKRFYSRHLMPGEITLSQRYNSIESSSDITQEAMRDVDEEKYDNLVKENQQESEQQEELGEHYEDISEAGKESDNDNKIEEISNSAEIIEDTPGVQTTAQTIKDAFGKDAKKQKKAFSLMKTEAGQAFRDLFSPAISRIYNISPRVAGRLVQMEGQREIYVARYRDRAKPFVEVVSKLNDKDKLEVKKALLDYGALASEQGENIEQYKKDEVAKLKETLNKYGITDDMLNDVVGVLNELGQRYKDAGLSITLTDMYFPRTVTDYEGLSQYIAEKTGTEGKERENLVNRIAKIRRNENLTEEEKEKQIRHILVSDYKTPGTTSKYGKERKMGKLSDWGEGIYQFYADPMESLDSYIVNMENAIQRQLFLGGLQEDAGLKGENVSFTEIVEGLVDEGKISNDDLEELKKTVLSVLNKKPSPKIVRTLKDATYIMTLTNFLSAINQLDDLGMAIIKNKNGLKHVVKSIFGKAGIKYDELGLEDSYEMFRGQGKITNWLFKKSFFSTFDRLGKTSFVNAAWDSLISQAKKNKDGTDTKSRINLKNRLVEMYGEETAEHMMEKIDSGNYMTNGQIDIDILVDLLYQLGSTQPIFTSAMPTVYLNNPRIRLCYALQSFTIKRIDLLVQGTKQVYKNNGGGAGGAVVAGAWLMGVSSFLAMFGVAIGDLQDWLKDEEEETALWKLLNEGIDEALKEVWNEGKSSWLKIWNLSLYDKKTYNREGLWGLIMSKVKPPMIGIGKNFVDAITEHNADEATDLIQYIPIIGKLLYYRYFDDIAEATGKSDDGYIWREDSFSWRDDDKFTWRDDKGFTWRE